MAQTDKSITVRIGHTLCDAEKEHVARRRTTVLQNLKQHGISCNEDNAPNIALLGSGGGLRAMVGLLGSLSQLKKEGLLDSATYLSGVSGSTWCMASLYKELDWSNNLETLKENIKKRLADEKVSIWDKGQKLLNYYWDKIPHGNFSLTDVWAALVVSGMVKEIDDGKISKHRGNYDNDPYPIYTVIDKLSKYADLDADCWLEITPDETSYSLSGVSVDTAYFGCHFENGKKIKDQDELDLLFLQGLCGSAMADRKEIFKHVFDTLLQLSNVFGISSKSQSAPMSSEGGGEEEEGQSPDELIKTMLEMNVSFFNGEDPSQYCETLKGLMKDEQGQSGDKIESTLESMQAETFSAPQFHTKIKDVTLGVCRHVSDWFKGKTKHFGDMSKVIVSAIQLAHQWMWGSTYNYAYKMNVPGIQPSVLNSEKREYEDAGLLNNSPYLSVLRKERDIDLIISLDFSAGDPFMTVVDTAKTCKSLNLPFPEISIPSGDDAEPQDYYVFRGSANTPTVIHIPLFNRVNCPGEVEKWRKTYSTFQTNYDDKMISDLLEKAGLNISNNKKKLLEEIKYSMEQRKARLG